MVLSIAQSIAWDLAQTLMTVMVIVRTDCGFGVMRGTSSTVVPPKSLANMIRSHPNARDRASFPVLGFIQFHAHEIVLAIPIFGEPLPALSE
ncbi:hypothetical protein M2333_000177 [Sphingobium sp. B11D3B]|uniref:hypothetical protein n=1 Tax=Sphingobium sp. B11D3B TaxID=2940575 RepID=UPI002227508B|nr:hypothetical protein [Sphingobium sp. B11D3B]MCW2387131.1 hypothetical protein [Sphingobium sp. B11D3B]